MRGKWAAAGAAVAALAMPAAASAHPFDTSSSAFMPELPENTIAAEAAPVPGFFDSTPPAAFDKTPNMLYLGFSARPAPAFAQFNSDLAFQRKRAYQGSFQGFRILDISRPWRPEEIVNLQDCANPGGQGQGDVVIYGDILTRSWDAPAAAGSTCDGQPVPQGTQGLHVFDVSDEENPEVVAYIPTECGSHTATGVPDPANRRLLVYSTPSSGLCDGIDVISIPQDDPASAEYVRFEPSADRIACHDTGVILGRVLRAACAGGEGYAMWSLGGRSGGSLEDPELLYIKNIKQEEGINVNTGHSAAFSNDGRTLIFGHEPNGGTAPRCQPTGTPLNSPTYPVQTDDMKSFFFFGTETGELRGKWTLPRDQTAVENCTLHNYNVVPMRNRDILVHGSYQSGTGVLDFTDVRRPREIGYADPKPIDPSKFTIGGDWSSHYYNGLIYESDITRGFLTWAFLGREIRQAARLPRLNPQTQEWTTKPGW